jgi:hypothetical protein
MLPASLVLPGAEILELLHNVLVVLTRYARHFVLAGESTEMAHGTQRIVGDLLAFGDFAPVDLVGAAHCLLRRKVGGEFQHVVARQIGSHRGHERILAATLPEVLEL